VLFAVMDSGPGLPPASLERLFGPFCTTKAGGLGVGLSICRSIIEAHGGRLWASANVPRGAIFQFTVPVKGTSSGTLKPMKHGLICERAKPAPDEPPAWPGCRKPTTNTTVGHARAFYP